MRVFVKNDELSYVSAGVLCNSLRMDYYMNEKSAVRRKKQSLDSERKKKMKKRILAGALVLTMAATAVTGCGKRKSTTETTEWDVNQIEFKTGQQINTTEKIQLLVWESAEGPDEFIEKAGEYFTKLYPNITIKYTNVESTDANSKIVMDGPGGHGPDLFATAHNNCGVMAAGTHIEPIPESEREILESSCTPAALQGATLNAKDGTSTLYGFPVSVETYAVFYNKALIKEEEVPKTMSELVDYISNYKNGDVYPFLLDAGNAYYSVMFTSSPENKLYGPQGSDITNTYMNTDTAVAQMADFVALSKAIGMKSGDIDFKHNDSLFAAGKLVMDVSGAWNIKTFKEAGVDFGITAIPSMTGSSQPPTNFMGVRCMYVSSYSKHKPEAIAFAEFLMTKEMQQLRCEITSTMPARDDVLANINNDEIKEYMEGLNKQIAYSYPMPSMSQASLFWSAFGSAYSNIWNGEATDIQAELNKADANATKKD